MGEISLVIPTDILKTLYNGVSSMVMGMKSILIVIENDKLMVRHINDGRSALMSFISRDLQSGVTSTTLPIDVSDLKTVVNLSKDSPTITFLIGEGYTTCKIGRTTKQFAQPSIKETPTHDPKFETNTSMEFDDNQANNIITIFSDLKEQGDLKITTSSEGIKFSVKEDNRFTETEFAPDELSSYINTAPAFAGYGVDMAISIFKIKQKGSNLKIEIGKDVPMRATQTTVQGTITIILAPKIYSD